MQYLENRPFNELQVGDSAELKRVLTEQDIQLFAIISGDINPAHLDKEFAKKEIFHQVVGHGMWGASLISTVLGTQLPGPGTIYLNQSLRFHAPVAIGDALRVVITVTEKNPTNLHVILDCKCLNQKDKIVISGTAEVLAPKEKMQCVRAVLPEIKLQYASGVFNTMLEKVKGRAPLRTAVVHATHLEAIEGAVEAAEKELIIPIFIGPKHKLLEEAKKGKLDLSKYEIINTEHSHAAATMAVEMAQQGKVQMLMKGSLHTGELLHEVVKPESGLRTERRLSHAFILDVPTYPRPLFITDAVVNIQPTLEEKRDIIQNAIDLAFALSIDKPRVAILSAIETVSTRLQSTLDAAALCKMAERGQISGGILDGPLAFDSAISEQTALLKDTVSPIAGKSDILVVPDLETGNILAKQLEYLAHARSAGIVLGARVPIVLTSRTANAFDYMISCAVAMLSGDYQSAPHQKLTDV